eukprot:210905-Chlamydomonas_euryale.AAC.2
MQRQPNAQRLISQTHPPSAHSKACTFSTRAPKLRLKPTSQPLCGPCSDVDDFCEEHPEVVILSMSILSTDTVLSRLPMMRLKRSTLIVDVLSVKV